MNETNTQLILINEHPQDGLYRILSLDGGGAKGFYTLGVLKEIEGMIGCPLYKRFDLVFGTSTGAIIASLIALGYEIDAIYKLYKKHVPSVMRAPNALRGSPRRLPSWRTRYMGQKNLLTLKQELGSSQQNG